MTSMPRRLRGYVQWRRRLNRPVAILQDLQGPKIRTGALEGGMPIFLTDGHRFV